MGNHSLYRTVLKHVRGGQNVTAIATALGALGNDPTDAVMWTLLGQAYTEINAVTEAGEAFRTALLIDDTKATTYEAQGVLFLRCGAPEHAHDSFSRALHCQLHDDIQRASIYRNMALTLIHLRRTQDGIFLLEEAVETNPDDTYALHVLGVQYMIRGRRQAALPLFERVRKTPGVPRWMKEEATTRCQRLRTELRV